jgi:hypothetical protein
MDAQGYSSFKNVLLELREMKTLCAQGVFACATSPPQ